MGENENLLVVQDLVKCFPVRKGLLQRVRARVCAVDGISFAIRRGETLGLVGESGCGKTTLARTILRLIPATGGSVTFDGRDVFALESRELKRLRRDMQIIFQDPFSSLDPRMRAGESIAEGLTIHGIGAPDERHEAVSEMLRKVQLQPDHADRYPRQFSGGQRQRIAIARALILRPRFVVCDEPVSTLDVSIQAQVLNLLMGLQAEYGLTYLFISHNLGVVEHVSDRVAVMYLGKIVELADRRELYQHPQHPYTQALMSAIPVPDPRAQRRRVALRGDMPSVGHPPAGCRFHLRCPFAMARCREEGPVLRDSGSDHRVACWLVE
ncbi:MAG: dipeptide ABC transporter ATP-binding protein [Anaerolineae bacterium]|nr:dipeptide ABC transporter ATP-binding protein [Anaerolineae bacterium]